MLSDNAKLMKKKYMKEWRDKNKTHVNEYQKSYRENHPEIVQKIVERYWEKRAAIQENQN